MSPQPPYPASAAASDADALAGQAQAWITALASGAMDRVQLQAFEQWLAMPGHRRVFEYERQLWRSLGPRPASSATPVPVPAPRRRRTRWQRLAWASVAVLALAQVVPEARLRLQADHRSGAGLAEVALPDGSRAVLDAHSAIAVRYDAHARRVELLRGQAWFDVSADPRRPFQVGAGGGVVEDISTAFAVARRDDGVEAMVEQGRVRVTAREGGRWTYLDAGQRARYGDGRAVNRLDDVAPDRIASWRQGELLLEASSVSTAVQRIARYRQGPTFVRGELSSLPAVNAALRVDRPEQALDALADTAGLQITRLPLGIAIVRPATPRAQ